MLVLGSAGLIDAPHLINISALLMGTLHGDTHGIDDGSSQGQGCRCRSRTEACFLVPVNVHTYC